MNPMTLETLGLYDFDGQLPSCTFTAHPKLDPVTKEFVCFGYEAKGDGTPDVCYFSFNLEGKLVENVSMVAPICAMIHDFAVTENWVCSSHLLRKIRDNKERTSPNFLPCRSSFQSSHKLVN